jgi:hypothetical protein
MFETYNQRAFGVAEGKDTVRDKLSREAELFAGVIPGAAHAARDYLVDRPWDVAGVALTSALAAGGLMMAARNPAILGRTAMPYLKAAVEIAPKAFGALMGIDLGFRLGVPMYVAWTDPGKLTEMKAVLATNVGTALVDYTAGLAGGVLGAAIAWKATPAWVNRAPSFDPRPSLRLGEKPRDIEHPDLFRTRRENQVADDVVLLYEKSFPKEERQPTAEVKRLVSEGRIVVHATRDGASKLHSFSFTSLHDETPFKFANLDFIATEPGNQSRGVGSLHAMRLNELLRGERPDLVGTTLEMESPHEASITADQLAQRIRRAKFYDRLDAPNTNVRYHILDFQDPSYRGPAQWRAWVYKPEEFDAVKAARLMLTDEGGYGLKPGSRQVREFDRLNNYWQIPFGRLKAGTLTAPLAASAADN